MTSFVTVPRRMVDARVRSRAKSRRKSRSILSAADQNHSSKRSNHGKNQEKADVASAAVESDCDLDQSNAEQDRRGNDVKPPPIGEGCPIGGKMQALEFCPIAVANALDRRVPGDVSDLNRYRFALAEDRAFEMV
jgi:hypothetical protein